MKPVAPSALAGAGDTQVLPVTEPGARARRTRPRPSVTLVSLAVLTLAQLIVGGQAGPTALTTVAALLALVGLPVTVLCRRARIPADSGTTRFAYALGLTLLGLMVGGLLLNTLLPVVGVDRPLAPVPLAAAGWLVGAALLLWRRGTPLVTLGGARTGLRDLWRAPVEPGQLLGVLALVAGTLGAIRLNNDAGGGLALLALFLGAGALLVVLLRRSDQGSETGRDARTIYLVGAALLLATSLRGWGITGHDIQAEFLSFQLSNAAQHWQMSDLPSAYNACLSINILPTVLTQTTGLPGVVVFKVLLQLVFALVPVLTYLYGRRLVGRRAALTAATLTLAFPTFFTDMPYLVRQEIAFFFLALVLLALTEPGRSRWGGRLLVLVLALGVVLSHYSTTYVLLMAMAFALAGSLLASVVRRMRHRPRPEPDVTERSVGMALLNPLVAALLLGATLAWAGPITHTGGHAREVVAETIDAITGQGDSGPSSSDTSYWLFSGSQTSPRERMNMFVRETMDYRRTTIPVDQRVVRDPGRAELRPTLHDPTTAPPTAVGQALDAVGADPVLVAKVLKFGGAVLMQILTFLGLVWLLLRLRRREMSHEVALLAAGSMAALALIVLIPNLSVDYGVLRAFQQTLLVMAPMLGMGIWLGLRPLARRPRLSHAIAVAVPVGLLLALSGALPALAGGEEPRLAMANSGGYYDRFFTSDPEDQAIDWLFAVDHADHDNARLIASRNMNVRLLALSDNRAPIADRLYPTLLSNDAYVLVDSQIVEDGTSTVFYTGDLLTYTYPLGDLDRHLDLVYSGPDARVYR